MRPPKLWTCRDCGQQQDRPLTKSGRCRPCAIMAGVVAAREMREHRGPTWDKWVSTMRAKGLYRPEGGPVGVVPEQAEGPAA